MTISFAAPPCGERRYRSKSRKNVCKTRKMSLTPEPIHSLMSTYRRRLHALLTPAEHRLFVRLDTPQKIQTFLDRLPVNFSLNGDTAMSPRSVPEGAHGALRRRCDLRRRRAGLSRQATTTDGYPRTAERSGPHHHAVSRARAVGRDQQDQSRHPALARSDLSKSRASSR